MEAIPQHDEKQQLFREQLEANPDAHAADETSTKWRRLASAGFLTLAVLAVVAIAAWKFKGEVAEGKVTESQSLFMTCDLPKCEDKHRRRLDASPAPVKSLRAFAESAEWAEWSEPDQPEGPYEGTGKGTVCRQSPESIRRAVRKHLYSDAFGTPIVEPGKHTVKECSKKCNEKSGCKGFEYGKSDGRCELHVQDICAGSVKQSKDWFPKKETDFECFPKCQSAQICLKEFEECSGQYKTFSKSCCAGMTCASNQYGGECRKVGVEMDYCGCRGCAACGHGLECKQFFGPGPNRCQK